ncbi:hypothetical protein [Nocardia alni]|uniref:hypothetical protein n=1 Tax=Nocardia alni TaxID=2815723 RepID=UPI001C2242F6|nr:hypothetical protein [Nocardia alni]
MKTDERLDRLERKADLQRELTNSLGLRVAENQTENRARFDGIDRRFDGIDRRLDAMDQRFDGVEKAADLQRELTNSLGLRLAEHQKDSRVRFDRIDGSLRELQDFRRSTEENFAEVKDLLIRALDIRGGSSREQ